MIFNIIKLKWKKKRYIHYTKQIDPWTLENHRTGSSNFKNDLPHVTMTFPPSFKRLLGTASLLQLQLNPTLSRDMTSKSNSVTSSNNI